MPDTATKTDLSLGTLLDHRDGFYENEDGIYASIPESDYHDDTEASRRCSQSVLSELIDKSPAHARAKMEGEFDPSSSQVFGSAFHSAVLTPDAFELDYGMKERCAGHKNDGDRCTYDGKHPWICENVRDDGEAEEGLRWFCSTHEPDEGDEIRAGTALHRADVETLTETQMEKIGRMQEAIEHDDAAQILLDGHESAEELTVLWTFEPLGVKCKSRIDRVVLHPELGPLAVDLKTTRSAKPGVTPDTFGYTAAKYGYHRQAAFYMRALGYHSIPCEHFFIVAIEKQEPHEVVASEVEGDPLMQGDDDIVSALRTWNRCEEDDHWPGYRRTIEDLELPRWAYD